MKIAIFGTGQEGRHTKNCIEGEHCHKVVFYVDNSRKNQGKTVDGILVLSAEELAGKYHKEIDAIVIAVREHNHLVEIMQQLQRMNMADIYLYDYYKEREKAWRLLSDSHKPMLPYLETNITDLCNLKCQGCTHFSNLFAEDETISLKEFEKDMHKLAENVDILEIRLLGGEPLLNKDLAHYIFLTRELFPESRIRVVTNGLLIPRIDKELFVVMRENSVGFLISQYEPTARNWKTIKNVLEKNKVSYLYSDERIERFAKNINLRGDSDEVKAKEHCHSKGCTFLRNGKLYICPYDALLPKFFGYYGLPYDMCSGIDIYNRNIDWEKLVRKIRKEPAESCKYCSEKMEWFDWRVSTKPEMDEWVSEQ